MAGPPLDFIKLNEQTEETSWAPVIFVFSKISQCCCLSKEEMEVFANFGILHCLINEKVVLEQIHGNCVACFACFQKKKMMKK